jgi:hypothetical protein
MRSYICTQCSTPCYLIAESLLDGTDPDMCPYRGTPKWRQVNIDLGSIKEQLDYLAEV